MQFDVLMSTWVGRRPALRPSAAIVAATLVATASIAGAPQPARADTFGAASAEPLVTITRTPDEPFQPAYTNSAWGPGDPTGGNGDGAGRSYAIDVTVTEANGADDIETVELCVFDTDYETECSPSTEEGPDPRWAMLLTWTRPVDAEAIGGGNSGFAKVGTNNYALDATSSWSDEVCTYEGQVAVSCTADRFHTDLHFVFYVSDAMHAGPWWSARVVATNSAGQFNRGQNARANTDNVATMGVSYFGWVTTARSGLDYGTIEGTTDDVGFATRSGSLGSFVANGSSSIFLQAQDFTYEGPLSVDVPTTVRLHTEGSDLPLASGEVRLDCSPSDTFSPDAPSTVNVIDVPIPILSQVFLYGTGEAGDTTLVNTCRLSYAGGAPITKVAYEAYVWVGIGPSAPYSADSSWNANGLDGDQPLDGAVPGDDTRYVWFGR